jgi:SAM-dependent methyltransferase
MKQRRWDIAQDYERLYWQKRSERMASGVNDRLMWYSWRAREMEKRLDNCLVIPDRSGLRALEIGCGPVGIINFLFCGERHAVDPLEEYYRDNPLLSTIRDKEVIYRQGKGESLPFEDGYFDLIILDNVLDHVEETERVISEINRVLRPGGLLYLTLNIRTDWGKFIHKILSGLYIDKGHPHTFNLKDIRTAIRKHQMLIKTEDVDDHSSARERDMNSSSIRDKLKGLLGVSEYLFCAIAQKRVIN